MSPPDTATGVVLQGSALHVSGLVAPIPSCPAVLFPQQNAAPAAVRPQAKRFPVPMLVKVGPPATGTGVRVLVLEPSPSAPKVSSPQQYAAPLDVRAQLWSQPVLRDEKL